MHYLKTGDPYYADINFNGNWLNEFEKVDEQNINNIADLSVSGHDANIIDRKQSNTEQYTSSNDLDKQVSGSER